MEPISAYLTPTVSPFYVNGSAMWSSAQTNYPVMLTISNTTGISSGSTIYTNGQSQPDWSDLYFNTTSGANLSYWIETDTMNATSATVWVKIPSIAASSTTTQYNANFGYYTGGVSTENGMNTFKLFDDFNGASVNSSQWITSGGSPTVSSGILSLPNNAQINSINTFTGNVSVRQYAKEFSTATNFNLYGFSNVALSNIAAELYYSNQWLARNGGSSSSSVHTFTKDTWNITEIAWLPSNASFYSDGKYSTSITTNVPTVATNATLMSSSGGVGAVDWVLVRPYVYPEPSISSTNFAPVSSFTATPVTGSSPLTLQFNDTSANFPTSWNWSYRGISAGNNTQTWFSTLQNTTVSFTTGNYTIALNASNSFGYNISTQSTWINVTAPPVASFTTNTTSGAKPLAVAFTDTSTNASSYYWMFGDGNTSTVQSPTFTYNIAGTYTVNHSASNGFTTNWSNQTNLITVLSITDPNPTSMIKYKAGQSTVNIDNQTPYVGTGVIRNISSNTTQVISNFTWNPAYVSISNIRINQSSVNITGLSIDSYAIHNDLGYAIVNESKASGFVAPANATFDFNITYVKYVAPGTSVPFSFDSSSEYYDVGNSTYWHFNTITGANAIIGVWGPIGANFSANATTVAVGSPLAFSDTSTGYPDAWSWDFGDGSTSSAQNPVYSYATTGLKTVALQAYMSENGTITNTITKTNYINVTAAPPPAPVADFTGTPTTVSLGTTVQFNDTSAYSPTSWSWNFGDSGGSSLQNPTHLYTSIGVYNVSLTATNAQGSSTATKTNYINVTALAPPVASFTSNVTSGGIPLPVQFTDTTSNTPTSWLWTFGDTGATSTSQNPSHTFTTQGNWSVSLKATNAAGNNTVIHYINATTLSGFTRQDLYMDPEYTLTINFVDSVTNLAIPVVKVVNAADGTSVNTTTGTYTGTFGYTTAVLYCYSDGYQAQSVSYIMTGDRTETVQLIKSSTQTQAQSVWWTPHTVQLTIMDIYGKRLYNVNVTAIYNQSTMPENWISDMYGVQSTVSSQMVNKTLLMSGVTGSDGTITFTMLGSIGYDFYLTSSTYELDNYYVFAYPSDSMLNLYVIANGQNLPTAGNSTYTALQGSGCVITMPNTSWYNATVYYQDTAGLTTQVNESVWFRSNNTVIAEHDVSNPGTAMITFSTLVPNVKGRQYGCGYNFTRSGT